VRDQFARNGRFAGADRARKNEDGHAQKFAVAVTNRSLAL
jgi:hypothetical protein